MEQLVNMAKGFLAGGLAAAVSKTTVAPMDRVKLVLQLQNGHQLTVASPTTALHLPSTSTAITTAKHYNGIVDCFRKLCAEQGVRSLWRGNAASVVRCFPSNALNIGFRDAFRLLLLDGVERQKEPTKFAVGSMAAGGAAGATTLLILYPLDFARTRLAVDVLANGERRFVGTWHCLREIQAREGLPGLYRGFSASLQFVAASRAVFFGIFDTLRSKLGTERGVDLSFAVHWCLAQGSIITSSVVCYPLDTVRRRLMMQSGEEVKRYKSTVHCFQRVVAEEGVAALYKAVVSNSLRCTSGALVLALYYEALKYM